jgi:hypothetical protein
MFIREEKNQNKVLKSKKQREGECINKLHFIVYLLTNINN